MDVYRRDIVTDCVKELKSHFDRDSFRLRRLEAMRAEMLENWDLAIEILDQVSSPLIVCKKMLYGKYYIFVSAMCDSNLILFQIDFRRRRFQQSSQKKKNCHLSSAGR